MNTLLLKKLFALFALLLLIQASALAGWKIGDALPDLGAQGLEGKLPDSLKDKVVLVDFWASWCVPCAESFPVMEKLHQSYKDQGLVIIAVNTDEKPASMQKFLKKHAVTFTVVRDAAQKLVGLADAPTMPTSFLIGRDGKIRHIHAGYRASETPKQYTAEIEELLKEKP
jgi:thiol-disulfide isomerase/thioredoxin